MDNHVSFCIRDENVRLGRGVSLCLFTILYCLQENVATTIFPFEHMHSFLQKIYIWLVYNFLSVVAHVSV